jgi:hypothetical protein
MLVREHFGFWAFLFGPLWLLLHRAWIPCILAICAIVAIAVVPLAPLRPVLGFGLFWLIGLFGQDLRRWSLERRGFVLAQIVAASDREAALARLLDRRPDLVAEMAR